MSHSLAEELARIFVQPVTICAVSVADIDVHTLPQELLLSGVRPKRQLEYAAGRTAARQAIKENGHKPEFPAIGDGREPIWPAGLVGSITHTSDTAMAAVARRNVFDGIGIDIEDLQPLEDSVASGILTAAEIQRLEPGADQVLRLFSFKESVFKCVFPAHGEFIDFKDVEVVSAEGGLRAVCVDRSHAAASLIARVRGDSRCVDNHVVSACWLPAST